MLVVNPVLRISRLRWGTVQYSADSVLGRRGHGALLLLELEQDRPDWLARKRPLSVLDRRGQSALLLLELEEDRGSFDSLRGHCEAGSLTGAVHLSNDNAGVLRPAQ